MQYYPAVEYGFCLYSRSARFEALSRGLGINLARNIAESVPAVRGSRSSASIGILLGETDGQIPVLERDSFGRGVIAGGAGDGLGGEQDGREGIRDWVVVARSWRTR